MILVTHAVVGAAIVAAMPNHPVLGITLAFASHFAMDTIPHWDYKIYSDSINPKVGGKKISLNKYLALDAVRIGGDVALGFLLGYLFFFNSGKPWLCFAGELAAMIPDFLQVVYTRFPTFPPLAQLQRFHKWIHAKKRLYEPVSGALYQVAIIAAVIFIAKKFIN